MKDYIDDISKVPHNKIIWHLMHRLAHYRKEEKMLMRKLELRFRYYYKRSMYFIGLCPYCLCHVERLRTGACVCTACGERG
jgi:hypothetical protein